MPDSRLVRGLPVGSVHAVAAIEHEGRLVVGTAANGHYDGDCVWAGRHDCYESFLRVQDFTNGAEIAHIAGAGGDWVSLIVVDDRLQAVVANWAEPVRCWDVASGEGRTIAVPPGPVTTLAVGWRAGQPVALCDTDNRVMVWDLATGEVVEQFDVPVRGWPRVLAQIDGAWLHAVQLKDGTVSARRLGDGAVVREVARAHSLVFGLAVVGERLAVACLGGVELHDLRTGSMLPALADQTSAACLAPLMLGGVPHLVTGSGYGEVRLWGLTADGPVDGVRHADPIRTVGFVSGDEELLVTGDEAGRLRRWRGNDGRLVGAPIADRVGRVRDLAVARVGGGMVLLTAGGSIHDGGDSALRRWDLESGRQIGPVLGAGHGGESRLAVAEVDGHVVVLSGGNDGFLTMWDPVSGERLRHEQTGTYPVSGLAVGRFGGRPVAVVSRVLFEPVRFIDLTDWSQLALSVREEDWRFDTVHGLVTLDGETTTMVTTDGGGTLRLWTLDGGSWRVRDFEYEAAQAIAVAVTDLPRPAIAVAYADRALMLVDPATAAPVAGPVRLSEPATALAFNTSGELAVCYGIHLALFPANEQGADG